MNSKIDQRITAQKEKIVRELEQHVVLVNDALERIKSAETSEELIGALDLNAFGEVLKNWQP